MQIKKYEHIFFDLDHTLWDFDANSKHTLLQLYIEYDLAQKGVDDFEVFYEQYVIHNDRLWERYRNGYIKREELRWKRMWLTLLHFKIGDTSIAHELSTAYLEILPTQSTLVPFAKELLEHCKGKYELHLITNGFETTQWLKMQYSGIAGYFNQVVTSEKSNSLKPHADIFEYALKASGAVAHKSLMIGDAIDIDILGGINAGFDTAYYNPHNAPHNRQPTYEVQSLSQLIEIL